jgi:hypothetical protein
MRGGVLMRALFLFTLTMVWVGIAYAIVVGALAQ